MAKVHGKKFNQAASLIEKGRLYTLSEAVDLLERTNTVKFDPTIEIHFNLNIDPRQADQIVRSTISLPHGTGKTKKIGAFTDLGNEAELKAAGVTVAGAEDLIDSVAQGHIDFDIAIATPGMMRKMGKIAKILGPKGIMPNPKAGTVTTDIEKAVKESKAGKIEYRVDKQAIVHLGLGKTNFTEAKLLENATAFLDSLKSMKPASLKGQYIKSIYISSTMGPSIAIENIYN